MSSSQPVASPRPDSELLAEAACLDCGTALVGPFCHACGQRVQPLDVPVRQIVVHALGDLFAWDGRVLQSARTLIREPGRLALDWAEGRRTRHVAPFRLYLLCSLVFVVATAGYWAAKEAVLPAAEVAAQEAAELRDDLSKVLPAGKVEAVARYFEGMGDLGSRWMFVLMPLGGFGLYVFYGLRRRSFSAHFVLAIHVFCVVILALAVRRVVQIAVLLASQETLSSLSETLNVVLLLAVFGVAYAYATFSIRRFYGVPLWKAAASAPAVTVGPILAWFGLVIGGMVLILAWP